MKVRRLESSAQGDDGTFLRRKGEEVGGGTPCSLEAEKGELAHPALASQACAKGPVRRGPLPVHRRRGWKGQDCQVGIVEVGGWPGRGGQVIRKLAREYGVRARRMRGMCSMVCGMAWYGYSMAREVICRLNGFFEGPKQVNCSFRVSRVLLENQEG
jgi:hypothetical protein